LKLIEPIDHADLAKMVTAIERAMLEALTDAGPAGLTNSETAHTAERSSVVYRFYMRADQLREHFGQWDACDPVVQALLNLTAAQCALAAAIEESVETGDESGVLPAIVARRQAADDLMRALAAVPDAYQGPLLRQ